MEERTYNFRKVTRKLISKLLTELPLAGLLGTLPILIYCDNEQSVDEMISGLLAISQLISYYAWLLAPYALFLMLKYLIRFRSDRNKNTFNLLYKIITEAGTGFQTILRTGVGVAFGIFLLPTEITTLTSANYPIVFGMILASMFASCAISFFTDEMKSRTERQAYKNPIKLDIK